MKLRFKHYLHDDKESWAESVHDALSEAGFTDSDEREAVLQSTTMPFYEVTYLLELDTDTGEVEILDSDI